MRPHVLFVWFGSYAAFSRRFGGSTAFPDYVGNAEVHIVRLVCRLDYHRPAEPSLQCPLLDILSKCLISEPRLNDECLVTCLDDRDLAPCLHDRYAKAERSTCFITLYSTKEVNTGQQKTRVKNHYPLPASACFIVSRAV